MNSRQRLILKSVAAVIFAMTLFAPFQQILPNGAINSVGYGFIAC